MPELETLHLLLLTTSLSLMIAQLWVKQKQTLHILFAIFCGSVSMATVKKITGGAIGSYEYLIGLGACATCNIYWLISRTLFRGKNAFSVHHLAFAGFIALLIMSKQGYLFLNSQVTLDPSVGQFVSGILSELTMMASSFVIIAAGWEAFRGFNQANPTQKKQRLLFIGAFISAVAICKVASVSLADNPNAIAAIVACVTIGMLSVTQILIYWQGSLREQSIARSGESRANEGMASVISATSVEAASILETSPSESDAPLAAQIHDFLIEQKQFLQPNLKVADLARQLDVPEYRISRILKQFFEAKNFNHYINQLRIDYAKTLLKDPLKQKWPVLVVGLESGFASVGPFTRAFKSFTGCTPNQYRQQLVD